MGDCPAREPDTKSLTGKETDFRTVYRLEYTPKKGISYPPEKLSERSPLRDAYLEFLVPREDQAERLPEGIPYEDVECVLHRARVKGDRPDTDVVRKSYELPPQSEYQEQYCLPGDYESERSRSSHHVPLPPEWKFCQTTHCGSYREPTSIASFDLTPPKSSKIPDNLVPNKKEREIRHVRTGDSDYTAHIGSLGEFILKEKLYGERKRKGMSKWEAKRRLEDLLEGRIHLD